MNLTDEVIAKAILEQRDTLLKQVAKYDSILIALGAETAQYHEKRNIIDATNFRELTPTIKTSIPFKPWVIATLKEHNMARTARQLLDQYNKEFNVNKDITDFCARFADTKKEIKHTINQRPYLYGLPQWFRYKELKPQYMPRVEEPVIKRNTPTNTGYSFYSWLAGQFKDKMPKTPSMLLATYKKEVNPHMTVGALSVRMGDAKNKKGIIKTHKVTKIEGVPVLERTWYGPASWFDGNKLKKEYLLKIPRPKKN